MSAAALGVVSLRVGSRLAAWAPPAAAPTCCFRSGEADVQVEVSEPQMQDSAAGPVHDVCQQDDDQDDDHQPEEEHDDSGDGVPGNSSRSNHGLQLPGAARIIRNGREWRGPCPLASCSPSWTQQTRRSLARGLICGKVASAWVAVPPHRGISAPIDPPGRPACSCGAGVAAGAARRVAAGIVDSHPRIAHPRIARVPVHDHPRAS
jgi:hypothetical protein